MSVNVKVDARRSELAEDNLHAQDILFQGLVAARLASGKSIGEVADCLGIPADVAKAAEEGRVEMTLADLRQYAYAVDALVVYRVRPRYSSELRKPQEISADWKQNTLPWNTKRPAASRG